MILSMFGNGFGNFKCTSTKDCCLLLWTWECFHHNSQRTYFCHVPGHICLLSPPPEECLPVGECLFVIAGQCLTPVCTFLGQTFLALSIMSWHKRDWGAVSLIESRVSSGPVDHPPTDCQVSRSDMHFLDFIHSLWKVRKWAFNAKKYHKGCLQHSLIAPSLKKE